MYETIVVGTDGSQSAELAVQRAAELASQLDSRIVVVHAYQAGTPDHRRRPSQHNPHQHSERLSREEQAEEILNEAKRLCLEAGVTPERIETKIAHTEPAISLLDLAAEIRADLIVMGSRQIAGPKRVLLGSVSQRVTDHSSCDVTIVRTTA